MKTKQERVGIIGVENACNQIDLIANSPNAVVDTGAFFDCIGHGFRKLARRLVFFSVMVADPLRAQLADLAWRENGFFASGKTGRAAANLLSYQSDCGRRPEETGC